MEGTWKRTWMRLSNFFKSQETRKSTGINTVRFAVCLWNPFKSIVSYTDVNVQSDFDGLLNIYNIAIHILFDTRRVFNKCFYNSRNTKEMAEQK